MRYIIVILLSCSLTIQAQKTRAWKVITLYSSSIVLNATGDALNNTHNKQWGHIANSLSIGLIVISPLMINYNKDKWYLYPITYGFIRIALFDLVYNAVSNLPLTYTGNTSYWDRCLLKVPNYIIIPTRAISLSIGITIPIKYP
jgi:hypothetical protein